MSPRSVVVFWLAAAWIAGAGIAAAGVPFTWTAAGLTVDAARWNLGERGPLTQASPVAFGEMRWSPRLDARLELRASRAGGGGARLGPAAAGAGWVRIRPRQAWLIQFGCVTPSGLTDLSATELALGRSLGEALLFLPEPDPAHGWRLHFSALWGRPLRRGLGVLLGVGGNLSTSFRAAPSLEVDTGDQALAQVALTGAVGRWRGRSRVSVMREGVEKTAGVVSRGGRNLYGLQLDGSTEVSPLRIAASLAGSRSGHVAVAHPEVYGIWRHPGPGSLSQGVLSAEPVRTLGLAYGWVCRPALEVSWRRVMPEGLPVADGWASDLGLRCAFVGGAYELVLAAAREQGRWRSWEDSARAAPAALHGWRIRVSVRWTRGEATGPPPAEPEVDR